MPAGILLDLIRPAVLAVSFPLSGPWGQTFRRDMQVQLPGLLSRDPGEVWKGDIWVIVVACRRPVGGRRLGSRW